MPTLKNDLQEIWGDMKESIQGFWSLMLDVKEAPPTIRKYLVALVRLYKQGEGSSCEEKGTFIVELYELARQGQLRCQREKTPELYRPDGSEKSAFELAVLPFVYSDKDDASHRPIQKAIETEYQYQIRNKLPLPYGIFKFRVKPDYLKNISAVGLEAGEVRDININLINPKEKTTPTERLAHWGAQRVALLLALVFSISVAQVYSPLVAVFFFAGAMAANWCAKEFFTYDLTEMLLRDIAWFRKFSWKDEKLSAKKILKTALLLGVLVGPAIGVAMTGWQSIMLLAWPTKVPSIVGIGLSLAKYSLALGLTALETSSFMLAMIATYRFFWGFGPRDTQYGPSEEEKAKAEKGELLPTVEPKNKNPQTIEERLELTHQKFLKQVGKSELSKNEQDELLEVEHNANKNYLQLVKGFKKPEPADSDLSADSDAEEEEEEAELSDSSSKRAAPGKR